MTESEEKVAAKVKALPSSFFLSLPLIFPSTCHGLCLKMSDDMFFISVKKFLRNGKLDLSLSQLSAGMIKVCFRVTWKVKIIVVQKNIPRKK